jgi:hypothetical protein
MRPFTQPRYILNESHFDDMRDPLRFSIEIVEVFGGDFNTLKQWVATVFRSECVSEKMLGVTERPLGGKHSLCIGLRRCPQ